MCFAVYSMIYRTSHLSWESRRPFFAPKPLTGREITVQSRKTHRLNCRIFKIFRVFGLIITHYFNWLNSFGCPDAGCRGTILGMKRTHLQEGRDPPSGSWEPIRVRPYEAVLETEIRASFPVTPRARRRLGGVPRQPKAQLSTLGTRLRDQLHPANGCLELT